MPKRTKAEFEGLFKVGDRVKIRNYDGQIGRVVELRGPLGPGGALIYRVLVRRKPAVSYIELRGDQLEFAPASEGEKGTIESPAKRSAGPDH